MVDCDNCGASSDSINAKEVCIHCFRQLENEVYRLRKKLNKLTGAEKRGKM